MTEHHDPVTGDPLTTGEWVSWQIQKVIRNWAFLGLITLATLVCWASRNDMVLTWWNLAASYAALLIEGVTAMALINMSRRDSAIIRYIKRMVEREEREIHAMTDAPPQRTLPLRDARGRFTKKAEK